MKRQKTPMELKVEEARAEVRQMPKGRERRAAARAVSLAGQGLRLQRDYEALRGGTLTDGARRRILRGVGIKD